MDQVEHLTDSEKANNPDPVQTYIPSEGEYNVTFKTWIVVGILSWSYGVSFWIVPSLSNCMTVVATQLGDPTASAFYVAVYTMTVTIAFMVCGGTASLSHHQIVDIKLMLCLSQQIAICSEDAGSSSAGTF